MASATGAPMTAPTMSHTSAIFRRRMNWSPRSAERNPDAWVILSWFGVLTEAQAVTDIVVRSAFGKTFKDILFGFLKDLNEPKSGFWIDKSR
jgi:hypothetical protein